MVCKCWGAGEPHCGAGAPWRAWGRWAVTDGTGPAIVPCPDCSACHGALCPRAGVWLSGALVSAAAFGAGGSGLWVPAGRWPRVCGAWGSAEHGGLCCSGVCVAQGSVLLGALWCSGVCGVQGSGFQLCAWLCVPHVSLCHPRSPPDPQGPAAAPRPLPHQPLQLGADVSPFPSSR